MGAALLGIVGSGQLWVSSDLSGGAQSEQRQGSLGNVLEILSCTSLSSVFTWENLII